MKTLNHLMLIVAAATVGVSLSAQTCQPSASAGLTDNAALLSSPQYREVHTELLLGVPSGQETPALTENAALANSPRFREVHPEVLLAGHSPEQPQAASEADRSEMLTKNTGMAASPRFREVHPELLHGQSVFEIAPVK